MSENNAVDVKGVQTVLVKMTGHEKTLFAVVLAWMADGTKLCPMLIFKRKTMPKIKFLAGAFMHVHEKGWMDGAEIKLWLDNARSARPGGLWKQRSLLVSDMFLLSLDSQHKEAVGSNLHWCHSYSRRTDITSAAHGCFPQQAIQGLRIWTAEQGDDQWGEIIHKGW